MSLKERISLWCVLTNFIVTHSLPAGRQEFIIPFINDKSQLVKRALNKLALVTPYFLFVQLVIKIKLWKSHILLSLFPDHRE